MKRLKPGFKAYYETRLRHPLQLNDKIVYESAGGAKYHDAGSPHTVIMLSALIILIALTLGVFYWTKLGFQLVLYSGIFILGLHRIFRYFWTSFERVDEEGKTVEDKSLLYVKKRHQRSDAFREFADLFGCTKPSDENKYSRYKGWQKLLIFFEAVLVFGIVITVPIVTADSPYSRFCSIEAKSIPWYDNPNVEVYYSEDPITVDNNYGKIPLHQSADTLLQAYGEVRLYIDTFCPEAEITDCVISLDEGVIEYHFTFKNFRRGLLYKDAYQIISVDGEPE